MMRDLTMIVTVLISLLSVGFGVYKGIEANNAKGFAYQQAYSIIAAVQTATGLKQTVLAAALNAFGIPPAVVDLSRSSADESAEPVCSVDVETTCTQLAGELGAANRDCENEGAGGSSCRRVATLKSDIATHNCIICFSQ